MQIGNPVNIHYWDKISKGIITGITTGNGNLLKEIEVTIQSPEQPKYHFKIQRNGKWKHKGSSQLTLTFPEIGV